MAITDNQKMGWLTGYLGWPGNSERISKSRLYRFPDNKLIYYENRERNTKSYYWVRISERICEILSSGTEACHVIFVNHGTQAIVLPKDVILEILEKTKDQHLRQIDISIYPDDNYLVKGKSFNANWSKFVKNVQPSRPLGQSVNLHNIPKITNIPPVGQIIVEGVTEEVRRFKRSAAVVDWITTQAAGKCEACLQEAPFRDKDGKLYLEIHHLKTLADGGPDTPDNTIAVCPNCHRELHYGSNATEIRNKIVARIPRVKIY